jgi:hypothetical protein
MTASRSRPGCLGSSPSAGATTQLRMAMGKAAAAQIAAIFRRLYCWIKSILLVGP